MLLFFFEWSNLAGVQTVKCVLVRKLPIQILFCTNFEVWTNMHFHETTSTKGILESRNKLM